MKILPLAEGRLPDFVAYCAQHGREHDDSYLPDSAFAPGQDDPSYLLVDGEGRLVGAVAVMLGPVYRAARKGRFRILHALDASVEAYRLLVESVAPHLSGIDHLYLFVPEDRTADREALESLDFGIERYSWCLEKPIAAMKSPRFPEGYVLRSLRPGQDETAWCDIINSCFRNLQGHFDMTPDDVRRMCCAREHLDGGAFLLWKGEAPVGTVRVTRSEERPDEAVEISALGVCDGDRGRGLGRNLLRAGAAFGRDLGFQTVTLSVNAENSTAANLYLDEGFLKTNVMVCYNKRVAPSGAVGR